MADSPDQALGSGRLRLVSVAVGLLLAGTATAALVVTENPKMLRFALVSALWAFVLASFAIPRRRRAGGASDQPDQPGESAALAAAREDELRRTYETELEREVAARREYELQLEVYLRRELETGLREDVGALREEMVRLRGDLIERLDGELRMERIETTRLIGGSLRALQDEARRLGIARQSTDDGFPESPMVAAAKLAARPEYGPGSGESPDPWPGALPAAGPDPDRQAGNPSGPVRNGNGSGTANGAGSAADLNGWPPARLAANANGVGPAADLTGWLPAGAAVNGTGAGSVGQSDGWPPAEMWSADAASAPPPGGWPPASSAPEQSWPPAAVPPEQRWPPTAMPAAQSWPPVAAGPPPAESGSAGVWPPAANSPVPPPAPADAEPASHRHRRYRDEDEPNEVMSRLLGRG